LRLTGLIYSQNLNWCLFKIFQTSRVSELFASLQRHNDTFGRGLASMLSFMSKHGMPEDFPTDGSSLFVNESSISPCGITFTTAFEDKLMDSASYW
jgi:hypothetical protein